MQSGPDSSPWMALLGGYKHVTVSRQTWKHQVSPFSLHLCCHVHMRPAYRLQLLEGNQTPGPGEVCPIHLPHVAQVCILVCACGHVQVHAHGCAPEPVPGVLRPGMQSGLFLSLGVCVSLCASLCVSLSVNEFGSPCVCVSVSVCLSLYVYDSQCVCLFVVCLYVSLCESLSVCDSLELHKSVSVCVSQCVFLSVGLGFALCICMF